LLVTKENIAKTTILVQTTANIVKLRYN
jgi:hypothetical protein